MVHASSKVKSGGRDLQLPSMSTLTSKTSSQHFFLRTLKAIIHLREAARAAAEKARKQGKNSLLFPSLHLFGQVLLQGEPVSTGCR